MSLRAQCGIIEKETQEVTEMGRVGWQDRIVIAPDLHHGDPCIKGTRIPAAMTVELLEDGLSFEEIIRDYHPHITK